MKSNDKVQPTEKPFNRSLAGLEELRPSKLPVSGSNQTQSGSSSESSNQQAKELRIVKKQFPSNRWKPV